MQLLEGVVRPYAWGSHTAIAGLCGRPVPSPGPEAELWLGAHPAGSASIADAAHSLLAGITADPAEMLGGPVCTRFGDRLPYLLKLLAAEKPLSLQAHPSLEQARAGFARENSEGIPLDSPVRNYRDASHKPELIVALTDFAALAGFRELGATQALLESLNVPELVPYAKLLVRQADGSGLRELFATWMTLPAAELAALAVAVLAGCERYSPNGEFAAEAAMACGLAAEYPADAGVLAALLLNYVTLRPGQGLYLPAGNMHAYLHGFGVEIMANSDNVLRGGLTPKHVDVPELSRVLDFTPRPAPVLTPVPEPGGFARYHTAAPEFALWTAQLDTGTRAQLNRGGPRIAVSVHGAVLLEAGADSLVLQQGQAAWMPAAAPLLTVQATAGAAHIFVATTG